MKISRTWAMPSKWTFQCRPIADLLCRYVPDSGAGWVDPFAGKASPVMVTNDIEPGRARHTGDALEFLKSLPSDSMLGALFDPPYSVEQCLRRYSPRQNGTAGRAEYWSKCKDEIARTVRTDGLVLCFGWDSTGVGKSRGFELVEVLLVCHGACHNDTICTVELKMDKARQKAWII